MAALPRDLFTPKRLRTTCLESKSNQFLQLEIIDYHVKSYHAPFSVMILKYAFKIEGAFVIKTFSMVQWLFWKKKFNPGMILPRHPLSTGSN